MKLYFSLNELVKETGLSYKFLHDIVVADSTPHECYIKSGKKFLIHKDKFLSYLHSLN